MTQPRLLLVHAHPDDETINNGVTMAMYAAAGFGVTLVTCTRGEEGEVLVPELTHLASNQQDKLGAHRELELRDAMNVLGVTDHRFLGAPKKMWRDSGMMGSEPNHRKDNFWNADVEEAAESLLSIILEIKPHVMITYDENGGYGHPDHIQAHRVIDGEEFVSKKMDAMRAHPTQISVDGPFFALSDNLGFKVWGLEFYRLVYGKLGTDLNTDGRETDLFSGITL